MDTLLYTSKRFFAKKPWDASTIPTNQPFRKTPIPKLSFARRGYVQKAHQCGLSGNT